MNRETLYADVKRAFPKLDNKAVHAFCGGMWSQILKWKKEAVAEALAHSKQATEGADATPEALQKFFDEPMTDELRSKYAMAGIDLLLSQGGDMKELAEAKKSWGIGQGKGTEIFTVDFKDAFPDMHTAKEIAMKMIAEQMKV